MTKKITTRSKMTTTTTTTTTAPLSGGLGKRLLR